MSDVERQYSERFKARMVDQMSGKRRLSANALSKEAGASQRTLSRWPREAGTLERVNATRKRGIR